jgi:hypothetical protein
MKGVKRVEVCQDCRVMFVVDAEVGENPECPRCGDPIDKIPSQEARQDS